MKIVMKNFSTLLLLVGLLGCKPKETHLSGQIFIVTREAENIKLGLVEVQLIEKAQVLEFLHKRQAIIESELALRQLEYEAANSEYEAIDSKFQKDADNFESVYADMESRHKALLQQSKKEEALELWSKMCDFWNGGMEIAVALQDKRTAALAKRNTSVSKLVDAYPTADTYFSSTWIGGFKKNLTDADGKFSFSYPRDKTFTLFAKGERAVGEKADAYCWLINAPSDVENAQILLSNNNFVFADPDGYFKIKPKSELQQSAP